MRRTDKEITNQEQMDSFIAQCTCCRLAFADGKYPYIVPMNFAYERQQERRIFYFHCAVEGKKLQCMKNNQGAVSFELDGCHRLKKAKTACEHTFYYQSVIGYGTITAIENIEEKQAALQKLMQHYTEKADWTFSETVIKRIVVWKLIVEEMHCKLSKE